MNMIICVCRISSGIIEGCPLAGTCFALAIEPILNCFSNSLGKGRLGIVRACADDLGFALKSIRTLILLLDIYNMVFKISGLKLKVSKTCLVPVPDKYDPIIEHQVRS